MGNATVGFLGPENTFTEMAARELFEHSRRQPFSTISDCMDAVAHGDIDYGVVPLENTIEGSVNLTLDYLIHQTPLSIVTEITIPIQQHFVTYDHSRKLENIQAVYSHPQAIAQCHHFLKEYVPNAKIHYMDSTASAAEFVQQHPEENFAAICNELAAQTLDLYIAEKNVHDYKNNHTRFVTLSHSGAIDATEQHDVDYKTTFLVTLPSDYPGALHQVLSAFSWRRLNLSKIESRPMKTGLGRYCFIIDVMQGMDETMIPGVKAEIEALGCSVEILGSYPCFTINTPKVK
ncbi:prephenate dehydratase [Tuberibacillus sp. Marseille-P3662]|uniref:prephenate dehydratase n=1 Tax=Tuberibacillus sp. Marseille-P3662 TaxID=1965358 RepID=UPI000A1CDC6A|nr:prephenate dehydratase [Tuberibacillus sp. Marseille-P3662]